MATDSVEGDYDSNLVLKSPHPIFMLNFMKY